MESEFLDTVSSSNASIFSLPPFCTYERFSQLSGLTTDTIRGMAEKGHLPTTKIGKRRLINTALLYQQCASAEFEIF